MDPNATWKEICRLAKHGDPEDCAQLANMVLALDYWLVNGGFEPAGFRRSHAWTYLGRVAHAVYTRGTSRKRNCGKLIRAARDACTASVSAHGRY